MRRGLRTGRGGPPLAHDTHRHVLQMQATTLPRCPSLCWIPTAGSLWRGGTPHVVWIKRAALKFGSVQKWRQRNTRSHCLGISLPTQGTHTCKVAWKLRPPLIPCFHPPAGLSAAREQPVLPGHPEELQ